MDAELSRRAFAATVLTGSAAMAVADDVKSEPERDYPAPSFQPQFKQPQLGKTLVQDFVIFAHSDLDMTKRLLEKQPALANAFVDWGGGDWESGLGGAAHMGRRDIAEFLLDNGARIDIFCAAMLGHLDTVKQLITAHPKLIDAKGPHGFTLHWHAKMGGATAAPTLSSFAEVVRRPTVVGRGVSGALAYRERT
jgi:hypothetical protein